MRPSVGESYPTVTDRRRLGRPAHHQSGASDAGVLTRRRSGTPPVPAEVVASPRTDSPVLEHRDAPGLLAERHRRDDLLAQRSLDGAHVAGPHPLRVLDVRPAARDAILLVEVSQPDHLFLYHASDADDDRAVVPEGDVAGGLEEPVADAGTVVDRPRVRADRIGVPFVVVVRDDRDVEPGAPRVRAVSPVEFDGDPLCTVRYHVDEFADLEVRAVVESERRHRGVLSSWTHNYSLSTGVRWD